MTPVKLPPRPRGSIGYGNPYPAKYMLFARALADRGYRIFQIVAAFEECGVRPAPSRETIKGWIDSAFASERRYSQRKTTGLSGPKVQEIWRRRLRRMRELRAAGLSYRHVGIVMNLDFGLQLNLESRADQIRRILQGRMEQRNVKRLLEGGAMQRRPDRKADA